LFDVLEKELEKVGLDINNVREDRDMIMEQI
jgi:hypothetical protein